MNTNLNTNINLNSLQEIQYLTEVWKAVLPSVPAPPTSSFALWVASFGAKAVEVVINEIPFRLTRTTVPPTDAIYRIVSSQLKSRRGRIAAIAVKDSSFETLLRIIPQAPLTEQNICRLYVLFTMQEMVNTHADLSVFSDGMLTDTIYCQQQSLLSNPNLKQVTARTRVIVDSLEVRQSSGEGQAVARLRRFEAALRDEMKAQAVKDDARGNQ